MNNTPQVKRSAALGTWTAETTEPCRVRLNRTRTIILGGKTITLSASAPVDEDDFDKHGLAAVTLRGGRGDDELFVEAIDDSFGGAVGTARLDGGPGSDLCDGPDGARVRNCEDQGDYQDEDFNFEPM